MSPQLNQIHTIYQNLYYKNYRSVISSCVFRHAVDSRSIEKYEDDICIYNFVSSPENPLTWRIFSDTLMHHIIHRPTAKTMWYPTLIVNASMFLHKLTVLVLHYLPAFLLDLVFIVSGKKLRLVIAGFHLNCLNSIKLRFSPIWQAGRPIQKNRDIH